MPETPQKLDGFAATVQLALEHVGDPEWLGRNSPLAAPYFLGQALGGQTGDPTPAARGKILQQVLHNSASRLDADQKRLIDAVYLKRDPRLNNQGVALHLNLPIATFYRHRDRALDDFARIVNKTVVPPLRPESPQARPMVGRANILRECLTALRSARAVAITGAGGLGKTTLGLCVADQWDRSRVLWFTLRPGLNDQLSSIVFTLGYFLHGLGASTTWMQLVADQGKVDLARTLGLIRHDLATLASAPPLVCVDEVDLLRPERDEHAQVIRLLEELRSLTPLLVIGQGMPLEVDQTHVLMRLSPDEVRQLLSQAAIDPLSTDMQKQLNEATRGNPAFLNLFIALHKMGGGVGDAIRQLGSAPSADALLNRVWRRVDDDERRMLMALSVFRSAAPKDAWHAQADVLDRVLTRGLTRTDGQGGVELLPVVREFVHNRLTADLKIALHLAAGDIREARGEYTAAAYHYVAGRQAEKAIWVWLNHMTEEIERGQALVAHELFKGILLNDLRDDEDRRALVLVRSEISRLLGTAADTEAALQSVAWPSDHPATPYVGLLRGDALERQGQLEQALQAYRSGLQAVIGTPESVQVRLHLSASNLHASRFHNISRARTEALLARLQAEAFYGNVEEEAGNFIVAFNHYHAALDIAEKVDGNLEYKMRVYSHLGRLLWKQGDTTQSIVYLQKAMGCSRTIGDQFYIANDEINLSAVYIVAGQYDEALSHAHAGLEMAESMRDPYLIAGLCANGGEACFYLKRYDEAEQLATRALQTEEQGWRPYALTVLGLVHRARQQTTEAESALKQAVQAAQETQDKFAEAPAWRALGHVYRDQEQTDAARNALSQAQQLFEGLGLSASAGEVRAVLAEL